jgi:hypothetical protein
MKRKIYILCVANLRSGGPEALHQLRYYMDTVGLDAYIVYFNVTEGIDPMPKVYDIYGKKRKKLTEIEDSKDNILLTAESSIAMLNGFKHIQKYIWWLSVNWFDFNALTYSILFKHKIKKFIGKESDISTYCKFKLKDCIHVCGSKYAYEHVLSLGIKNVGYLVEPISKAFLESNNQSDYERNDIILYNPAKPSKIMSQLLDDGKFQFKALTNMTPNELIEAYKQAKLYIDFGHFGGPERMPKEAVFFGCCILVGRRNAAENDFDVAIPEQYKIKDVDNLDIVKSSIDDLLINYDKYINDFLPFKAKINEFESTFTRQINNIFR